MWLDHQNAKGNWTFLSEQIYTTISDIIGPAVMKQNAKLKKSLPTCVE